MKKVSTVSFLLLAIALKAQTSLPLLKITPGNRYFQTADGKPFFWLGDTGWLLFTKCSREETLQYLDKRKQQGFNVVQVMVLHTLEAVNRNGDSALVNRNIANPNTAKEKHPAETTTSGYWDNIDFVIAEAEKRGIYMALVPLWGSNVKQGKITAAQAVTYAKFLAERYRRHNNIIWLNGGDIKGSDGLEVWEAIGSTLKKYDNRHLVSFHPRGRTSSSEWFHRSAWLDFDMFQSGHKDYAQDTSSNEKNHFGEDNWKYVNTDYALKPVKPTIDGEPSYENIPHGLHDSLEKRWTAADLRRYAYWSVFAGGAGFTYGENAVMQFNKRGNTGANFGVSSNWMTTIEAPGATQMKYLKALMLSKKYAERQPAQQIIGGENGECYNRLLSTMGKEYAMVYTYTGSSFGIDAGKLAFKIKKAGWFNTKDGTVTAVESFKKTGIVLFDPPGEAAEGNDWVLLLEG